MINTYMNSVKLSVIDILNKIDNEYQLLNNHVDIFVDSLDSIMPGSANALSFISLDRVDKSELINNTKSTIIICDLAFFKTLNLDSFEKDRCVIGVDGDPKVAFSKLANSFFVNKIKAGVHPNAIIDIEAKVSPLAYIGPNTVIGKSFVGDGSVIHPNVTIYDNVHIGNNVTIHSGSVIGSEGFGYNRDIDGLPIQFPHIGGVIIENDVEIGSNTSIDRGALSNTIIRKGSKIDNLVHIAHNVIIGRYVFVIANSMIAGSTEIGEYTYIAPSVSVRDKIIIVPKSFVGMGSTVLKNISSEEVWTGNPARPLSEVIMLNKINQKLLSEKTE